MKENSTFYIPFWLKNALGLLLSAWLIAATAVMLPAPARSIPINELDAIAGLSWTVFILALFGGLLLSLLLLMLRVKILYICIGSAILYSIMLIAKADLFLILGATALWIVMIYYLWPYTKTKENPGLKPAQNLPRKFIIMTILLAIFQITIMSVLMVSRVYALRTPTYDHGIFSQVFYQMRTDGSQVTTLERSYPLSHFAVHISPILYLLLPFFSLVPKPETLQVLQILVVASGFIPLNLIMKHHKFQPRLRLFFAAIYFFLPALNGSSMFDFHENCFLAPLLLWIFYAIERRNLTGLIISGLLLIATKEDVVLYLFFIGIWLILSRQVKTGFGVIIVSVLLFLVEVRLLSIWGDGTLAASRFPNISAFPEWGILGAIPTLLLSPGYFLSQVFTEDKWRYILQMLLPLGFTPLLQRHDPKRLVLLFPFIIMNLISSYPYLHNIRFQYNYGNGVILLYLSLLFWSDLVKRKQNSPALKAKAGNPLWKAKYAYIPIATVSLAGALYMGSSLWLSRFDSVSYIRQNRAELNAVHAALDVIPSDSSVRATTFLTTPLSSRQAIYDLKYENSPNAVQTPAEYYVYDLRYELDESLIDQIDQLKLSGWEEKTRIENWVLILRKVESQ